MKSSSLSLPTAAALFAAALFAASMVAQAPQAPPQPADGPPPRAYPAPTNLKVLPKNLSGQQVHEIMERWEGSLGVHCSTCHTADPNNIGPNGRPRLNFADDSKAQKATARLMYKMTEDINGNYVIMVENSTPVTCGTCHRGHLDPEPFVIPPDEHDHDHEGPRPAQGPSQAPPPAGAPAPQPR
ncbi:MAG: c-type cytochrome [Terracidiphilus sp.]